MILVVKTADDLISVFEDPSISIIRQTHIMAENSSSVKSLQDRQQTDARIMYSHTHMEIVWIASDAYTANALMQLNCFYFSFTLHFVSHAETRERKFCEGEMREFKL